MLVKFLQRISFITGSHAYGTVTKKSDIDLVILGTPELKKFLKLHSDSDKGEIRFGKLNIICCDNNDKFDAWKEGTNEAIKVASSRVQTVDKSEAKIILDKYRKMHGVVDEGESEPDFS